MTSSFRSELQGAVIRARAVSLFGGTLAAWCASALMITWADISVEFPFGARRLSLILCLPAVLGLIHGHLLIDRWYTFTRSAVRVTPVYWIRRATVAALATLSSALPVAALPGGGRILCYVAASVMVAQVSVVHLGELYWIPMALLGMVEILLALSPGRLADITTAWENYSAMPIVATLLLPATFLYYGVFYHRKRG